MDNNFYRADTFDFPTEGIGHLVIHLENRRVMIVSLI